MKKIQVLKLMRAFSLIIICLVVNACAKNPVTGKKQLMLMSESQEASMGAQYDPSVISEFGMYEDKKLQDFIQEKGMLMGKVSHRPNLDYKFRVLDSPVVNAFAVPGGYVYFTRGIMAHFNNEAEFAGVLGHEIGHITARHGARQQTSQILGQVGLIAGMIASPEFAQYGEQASQAMGLMFLKFGRDHESESDKLGVEYSTKIGYDSHHMANFFNTLNRITEQAGQRVPTFLSTHPNPLDRFSKVKQMSDEWATKVDKSKLQENRDSYLRMIDGIIYGEDPRQGYVENWVFYHPELKFQFAVPNAWQYQNSPSQFAMAPKDGKSMMVLSAGKANSLQEAANDLVTKHKLKVLESANTTVNGLNALAMVADQMQQTQTPQGQVQEVAAVRLMTYLIDYNGLIYVINGMSKPADFNAYAAQFKNTMTSFKALNDASKINVKPERIRIKTVPRAATFAEIMKGFGVPTNRVEELAIVNSMKQTDMLKQGMLIKVFEK